MPSVNFAHGPCTRGSNAAVVAGTGLLPRRSLTPPTCPNTAPTASPASVPLRGLSGCPCLAIYVHPQEGGWGAQADRCEPCSVIPGRPSTPVPCGPGPSPGPPSSCPQPAQVPVSRHTHCQGPTGPLGTRVPCLGPPWPLPLSPRLSSEFSPRGHFLASAFFQNVIPQDTNNFPSLQTFLILLSTSWRFSPPNPCDMCRQCQTRWFMTADGLGS